MLVSYKDLTTCYKGLTRLGRTRRRVFPFMRRSKGGHTVPSLSLQAQELSLLRSTWGSVGLTLSQCCVKLSCYAMLCDAVMLCCAYWCSPLNILCYAIHWCCVMLCCASGSALVIMLYNAVCNAMLCVLVQPAP
jgi:hypothetical protein